MTDWDHPPHRHVRTNPNQEITIQVYPPGHPYNVVTNPHGKVTLVGRRMGTQQRIQIWAEDIDYVITALQYAKKQLGEPTNE